MLEKIEHAIKDLIASLQMAKLYSLKHLEFNKSLEKAYAALRDALEEKEELVIGLISGELAFEREILFDLTKSAAMLIQYFKTVGIERVTFYRQLNKEELYRFIALLISPKEEIKGDAQGYLSTSGVKNITVGKIKAPQSSGKDEEKRPQDYLKLYQDFFKEASASLEKVVSREELDYLSLKLNISGVLENLAAQYQELLKLVTVKRYDIKVFVHLLDVSILSMYFSSRLGLAREDVLDIGIAGLFHDIGKIHVSRRILNKAGSLSEEEFLKIKSHSFIGAEMLLRYTDKVGILPAVVALEHHLGYNLKGYPRLSFSRQPHLASLIVSICDVYDACFQRRSYKGPYPSNMIYDLMLKEAGRMFEPGLLEKFFKAMGVWPIGTIVYLSDQRIAVVRKENEDAIFSPQVEVVYPEERKEHIDLSKKAGSLKIEYSLHPLNEGRGYVDLI